MGFELHRIILFAHAPGWPPGELPTQDLKRCWVDSGTHQVEIQHPPPCRTERGSVWVSGVASGSPKPLSGDVLENHQEEGRAGDANESHFPVLVVGWCNSTSDLNRGISHSNLMGKPLVGANRRQRWSEFGFCNCQLTNSLGSPPMIFRSNLTGNVKMGKSVGEQFVRTWYSVCCTLCGLFFVVEPTDTDKTGMR